MPPPLSGTLFYFRKEKERPVMTRRTQKKHLKKILSTETLAKIILLKKMLLEKIF